MAEETNAEDVSYTEATEGSALDGGDESTQGFPLSTTAVFPSNPLCSVSTNPKCLSLAMVITTSAKWLDDCVEYMEVCLRGMLRG
jgi:hypothetical protein